MAGSLFASFVCMAKTMTVTARLHAKAPLESLAESVRALEPDRVSHTLDILIRHRQASARFVEPQLFNKRSRCKAKGVSESTAEVSRAKAGALRQSFYRQIAFQMRLNPNGEIGEAIG